MVSIEPADKGTAAGRIRPLGLPGRRRECGQVVFRTEGPKGPAAAGSGGEHPYPRRAGARGPQRRRFGRQRGRWSARFPHYIPRCPPLVSSKATREWGFKFVNFLTIPAHIRRKRLVLFGSLRYNRTNLRDEPPGWRRAGKEGETLLPLRPEPGGEALGFHSIGGSRV